MKIVLIVMVLAISLSGCVNIIGEPELKKMLLSDDKSQIIEATEYIAKNRDTNMVKDMLEDSFDPRVTHIIWHKGMSVYQIKMGAMKRLTGIAPPNQVTNKPDSVNIKFYLSLAKQRQWLE